jgi:hypothetical protein
MLELIFDPNLPVLPTAKCSKHLSENIGAVSASIEGRVTVGWKCPVCESAAMMEQTGESDPEPLQALPAIGVFLTESKRRIVLQSEAVAKESGR